MAKKKVSPAPLAAAPTKPQETHPQADEMENLKTLNNLLLKQTTEAREQIKLLRSQLEEFSQDQPLLSDLERTVSLLVLSSQLAQEKGRWDGQANERIQRSREAHEMQMGEMIQNEADRKVKDRLREADERLRLVAAVMEKSEAEAREEILRLRSDCEGLLREKEGVEKTLGAVAAEKDLLWRGLEDAKEGFERLKREKDEGVEAFNRILSERGENLKDLEIQKEVAKTLEIKVHELEKSLFEKKEALGRAQLEHNRLVEERKKGEMALEVAKAQKVSVELSLGESCLFIDDLRKKMKDAVRSKVVELEKVKKEMGAQMSTLFGAIKDLTQSNERLQAELSSCRDEFRLLKDVEEGLRSEVNELKKRDFEVQDELRRFQVELDAQLEDKRETIRSLELLLEESSQKLDDLRSKLDETEFEKDEILQVKTKLEVVVLELQKEVAQLHCTILTLQDSCNDQAEENDRLRADREAVQEALDLQRKEVEGLTLQVTELQKIKDGIDGELGQLRTEHNKLVKVTKERDRDLHILREDRASIKSNLVAAQQGLEDMERKITSAQMLYDQALSLLKSTAQAVCDLDSKENGVQVVSELDTKENGVGGEMKSEVVMDEMFQPFVAELETIKLGFRSRCGKMEDMKQQLKVLQGSVTEAQKKSGLWARLSSATAILAAISVAYAARGR